MIEARAVRVEDKGRGLLRSGDHNMAVCQPAHRSIRYETVPYGNGLGCHAWWSLPVLNRVGLYDAHVGNLFRTLAGRVVLCDFEAICTGPWQVDLAAVAVGDVRFRRARTPDSPPPTATTSPPMPTGRCYATPES